ncbi:hypothetical protein SISNIDRAFT_468088 [Sistotremastrum niveocremeum HHB9708]|uniref:Uncharacterized protein n=1 Tax=Sistotremastrum niveocremeum HHB9708 TaxID=1314777 RepID=A0A164RSJ2_9AGAM|nr:hypothetical protein SISNIDRAFT_468088 [Sistotremastrum niveocremeum HHB9708]
MDFLQERWSIVQKHQVLLRRNPKSHLGSYTKFMPCQLPTRAGSHYSEQAIQTNGSLGKESSLLHEKRMLYLIGNIRADFYIFDTPERSKVQLVGLIFSEVPRYTVSPCAVKMDDNDADYMDGGADEGCNPTDLERLLERLPVLINNRYSEMTVMGDDAASADVENQYYNAKSNNEDDHEGALRSLSYRDRRRREKRLGTQKALKQSTNPLFLRPNRPQEALHTYTQSSPCTKSKIDGDQNFLG